jgi:hypothetical protein
MRFRMNIWKKYIFCEFLLYFSLIKVLESNRSFLGALWLLESDFLLDFFFFRVVDLDLVWNLEFDAEFAYFMINL